MWFSHCILLISRIYRYLCICLWKFMPYDVSCSVCVMCIRSKYRGKLDYEIPNIDNARLHFALNRPHARALTCRAKFYIYGTNALPTRNNENCCNYSHAPLPTAGIPKTLFTLTYTHPFSQGEILIEIIDSALRVMQDIFCLGENVIHGRIEAIINLVITILVLEIYSSYVRRRCCVLIFT